ncbi:hypothetical protein BTJ40_06765 [Microbulbifer sp. A4B17]|uniref:SAM-dependent methyltransferase n=1 Tax=Microbulbifer sp. A4B17 TaxID=359370 RepID=UPI000D52DEBF|nr:SAM-dependent methyltransferase [Microbulbifer sp. A4B17]AWF80534.1 hypothetical protein BTJ40_06765 [Microbulbifer sp. A4B17]
MNDNSKPSYPSFDQHRESWEELASGIASIKDEIKYVEPGTIPENSKEGELIILGSGIETIGISLGDKKILEEADKVLFCVADPVTIVWLKKLRPDALDLYVLYGENKVRYTTYMQMTEAQLYWVRQGLKVAVLFYGHPGIFVLSTHRAIEIARREGYKARMKAGVSALDTLCADLGVDPSHPGLQTYEATDCIIRRRNIDPSLHVVLWQVGLIGELGYRRQGYLNNNFSYFVSWLEGIYDPDFEIIHYVGSRYPTIEPLKEKLSLHQLHDPEVQTNISGLSTFYIPPRDVIPTHYQTALDLGVISEGQSLVTPGSPLREIGLYGAKEMKAFEAFEKFKIPHSYKWQRETEASKFLISVYFDTELQDLYRKSPVEAVSAEAFNKLSDRERSLLVSRDSGAVQIACKGVFHRCNDTETTLYNLLTKKSSATKALKSISRLNKPQARKAFSEWLESEGLSIDWSRLHSSIDYIHRNNLYPFTGVYMEPGQKFLVTLIGNQYDRNKSVLYINDIRIKKFKFFNGTIKWKSSKTVPFNGFLRPDIELHGQRRIIGKIWDKNDDTPTTPNFVADEVDPDRFNVAASTLEPRNTDTLPKGNYSMRTSGRFSKIVNDLVISERGLTINQINIRDFSFEKGVINWSDGMPAYHQGSIMFLRDPIINSIEFFGTYTSSEEPGQFQCYGSSISDNPSSYTGPFTIATWARPYLASIAQENSKKGGLMLWHKWEKHNFTSKVVNKYVANLI